jgi:5-methylcytosine-specific restriction endonuclease McrA
MSRRSALRSNGSTTQWRKLREIVIRRDAGVCQRCGQEGKHVDHIVPRRLGGTDELSNLQLLCVQCNLSKGGRFFDTPKPPMTPLGLFTPRNGSIVHYSDEND